MVYDGECSNISTSFTRPHPPPHRMAKPTSINAQKQTDGGVHVTNQPAVSAIDYLFSSCVDMYEIWEVVKVDHKYLTPKGFSCPLSTAAPPLLPHYSFFLSCIHVTSLAADLLNSRQLMEMGDEELDEQGKWRRRIKHIPSSSGLGDLLASPLE